MKYTKLDDMDDELAPSLKRQKLSQKINIDDYCMFFLLFTFFLFLFSTIILL